MISAILDINIDSKQPNFVSQDKFCEVSEYCIYNVPILTQTNRISTKISNVLSKCSANELNIRSSLSLILEKTLNEIKPTRQRVYNICETTTLPDIFLVEKAVDISAYNL